MIVIHWGYLIREGGEILGLTGDNSPKKRIIEHTAWKSFTIPFISVFLLFHYDFEYTWWLNVLLSIFLVGLYKQIGFFFLLKIYSESGIGFNIYYQGWRIIGIDYHDWQVKQDPISGKPLSKDEQYFSPARPHIDIPLWHIHHWPWEQHHDHETLEELKREATERRAEKLVKKQERKAARAEKVRLRNNNTNNEGGPDNTAAAAGAAVEEENDAVDLSLFNDV
jgi:hypothetical protein